MCIKHANKSSIEYDGPRSNQIICYIYIYIFHFTSLSSTLIIKICIQEETVMFFDWYIHVDLRRGNYLSFTSFCLRMSSKQAKHFSDRLQLLEPLVRSGIDPVLMMDWGV